MATRTYKSPFSGSTYISEASCVRAIERDNGDALTQMGVTARQAMFNGRNRLPIGTLVGKSVISGRPTAWNEKAGRYQRFANDSERESYRKIFLERMRRVHGKDHLLDSPEQQRLMLANRRISGAYTFEDGSVKTYTGREELALLKFLNEALDWPGCDVFMPAPQVFDYVGEDGKKHFYIPDAYLETLNLIIEVKGPSEHGGWKDKDNKIQRHKDEVLGTSKYNYIKVEDQNYFDLLDKIAAIKLDAGGQE